MEWNDLTASCDNRYSRHELIDWWEQEQLAQAKILVVGAGAFR